MRFDEVVERRGTSSFKWDTRPQIVGIPEDLIPMWVADMDFRAPDAVVNAMIKRARHGIFGYTFPPRDYFSSIADWWKRRHSTHVDEEWIVSAPGVVPGIAFALEAFTEEGDGVVIQSPVYWPFYDVIESMGRKVVINQLKETPEGYEMDLEDLSKKLRDASAFILCSPHNPTGRVWSEEELEELAKVLRDFEGIVISDEIHMDFVFQGRFTSALEIEDLKERLVVLSSPNKTFNIAAIQNGYAIIPNESIRKRFESLLKAHHVSRPNVFSIVATVAAYTEGEEWLKGLLNYIEGNFEVVVKELDGCGGLRVSKPQGTYLMWLDFRETSLKDPFMDILRGGVWLQDGKVFGPGGEGFLRMNVATPRKILKEAIERIKKVLEGAER